jgi:hypothetical protein
VVGVNVRDQDVGDLLLLGVSLFSSIVDQSKMAERQDRIHFVPLIRRRIK